MIPSIKDQQEVFERMLSFLHIESAPTSGVELVSCDELIKRITDPFGTFDDFLLINNKNLQSVSFKSTNLNGNATYNSSIYYYNVEDGDKDGFGIYLTRSEVVELAKESLMIVGSYIGLPAVVDVTIFKFIVTELAGLDK